MRITSIEIQAKNKDRVNVSVDGKYRFSLDVYQVADLGIRKDREYSEEDLALFETESQFGKAYSRALEYCLMRPHSGREVRDYLYKKTHPVRTKTGNLRTGISKEVADRVYSRLVDKGYIDDAAFARYWVENRKLRTGISVRRIQQELWAKGVEVDTIELAMGATTRSDDAELQKLIVKKRASYADEKKFIAYLMRAGFQYNDIIDALKSGD